MRPSSLCRAFACSFAMLRHGGPQSARTPRDGPPAPERQRSSEQSSVTFSQWRQNDRRSPRRGRGRVRLLLRAGARRWLRVRLSVGRPLDALMSNGSRSARCAENSRRRRAGAFTARRDSSRSITQWLPRAQSHQTLPATQHSSYNADRENPGVAFAPKWPLEPKWLEPKWLRK